MTVYYRSKRTGAVGTYDEPFAPYELSDIWERFEPEPEPEPAPTPKRAPRKRKVTSDDRASA